MAEKRTINIDINSNASEAEKDFKSFNKAVDETTKSAKNLDATFEEVYGDLQPLTTRMGEAEDRLYELALAGNTTSKEYQELLEKVGAYRKVQIETDLAVDGAATTMGQKLGSALNGATSGFAATQGAMALFGGESEALEKSLLKVQGALAIQQGVQGLSVAYKELGRGTGIATKAQAAFNFVMNLNPIILIVTGVVAATAALLKFTSVLDPAIQGLKDFGDAIGLTNFKQEEAKQAVIDRSLAEQKANVARLEQIQKEIEAIDRHTEAERRLTDVKLRQIALDQAKAKSTQEVVDLEKEATEAKIALNEKEYNDFVEKQKLTLEAHEKEAALLQGVIDRNKARGRSDHQGEIKLLEERKKHIIKLNNDILNNNFDFYTENQVAREEIEAEGQRKVDEIRKTAQDKWKAYAAERLSIARKIEDIENTLLEDGIEKELEINRDKFRRLREDAKKNTKLTRKERARLIELFDDQELAQQKVIDAKYEKIRQEKIDKEQAELQELVDFNEELRLKEIEDNKAKNLQIIEDNKAAAAKQKEIDEKAAQEKADRQNAQIDLAVQGFQLIAGIAEAFAGEDVKRQKKAFQIKKVADIAAATVDGYRAVLSTYAQTPGGPVIKGIAAGLAGSFAALQIANIAKQQFQGGGDGADVAASADAGGGEAVTPQFNVVGDSGINQIAQLQQQPVQAFVVSGEVTTSQALDRNRVQNATL